MRLVSQISTLFVYVLITCPVLLVRGEISVRTTPGTLVTRLYCSLYSLLAH